MTTATSTLPTSSALHEPIPQLRSAGVAGLLAVATMIASFAVLPPDSGGATPEDIASRYADGRTEYLRAAFLETLSLGLFCLFTAGVCISLWTRRRGAVLPVAAAIGGTLLVTTQLMGYAVIATLAQGTAASGDLDVVMALYDLSAVCFVVANVGLAVLCASAGSSLLTGMPRARFLGWTSIGVATAAMAATGAYAQVGSASIHGDLGFVTLLLQLVWTAAVSVRLLRRGVLPMYAPLVRP